MLRQFQELKAVQYAFNGIRAGVLALLVKALWTMYKKSPKGWVAYVVMAGAFVATAFLNIKSKHLGKDFISFAYRRKISAKKQFHILFPF